MKFTEEELEKIKKEKMEEIDRWLDNEFGISYTRYKNIVDEATKYLYECKKTIENDKDYEIDDYLVSASILLEILKGE